MKNLTTKKLAITCIILLIINLLLSVVLFSLDDVGLEHLDGTSIEAKSSELIMSLINAQIISFPVLCLFLGAITTIFIEREKPYKKRYLKGFLLTLSAVYGIFSVMGIIRLILLL